jgi:FkbH-like protein
MFETTWKNLDAWGREPPLPPLADGRPPLKIAGAALLFWEEHCLECTPPECYGQCPIYQRRMDRKCVRMFYGMAPIPVAGALYDYGVDCRFRKWAKIETRFHARVFTPAALRRLDRWKCRIDSIVNGIMRVVRPVVPVYAIYNAYYLFRKWFVARISRKGTAAFDAFVLECHSLEPKPFVMTMQCDLDGKVLYRHAFEIAPGHNRHVVPYAAFGFTEEHEWTRIYLSPENDLEARIVFTLLDFVSLTKDTPSKSVESEAKRPAEKVKCVAWDLDNTVWKGILVEDGAENLALNEEVRQTIKRLDERGVIQTVLSKNTYEQAWPVLERLGLADYFVYPAINWNPKSENLREVAARINIGLDTFAVVDDSAFERAQISQNMPMVRVYPETKVAEIPSLPEFDLPVTEASRMRRLSYLAEMKRERLQAAHQGDDLAFLRSCGLTMEIFAPRTDAEKQRCLELIQRSNQLNLSTRRYTAEEFDALLRSPDYSCFGFRCRDHFGEYGIVGFVSVKHDAPPEIVDLVISCRIAKKHFEHAFFHWLGTREKRRGQSAIAARLIRTARNGPLADVFRDLPFAVTREEGNVVEYRMDLTQDLVDEQFVSVTATDSATPSGNRGATQ